MFIVQHTQARHGRNIPHVRGLEIPLRGAIYGVAVEQHALFCQLANIERRYGLIRFGPMFHRYAGEPVRERLIAIR